MIKFIRKICCLEDDDGFEETTELKEIIIVPSIKRIPLIIRGNNEWSKIDEGNDSEVVYVTGCTGLIRCPKNIIFSNCSVVIFDKNEKNFNFYTLNKNNFPNVEVVYFNGHPCDHNFQTRFPNEKWVVGPELENTRYFSSDIIKFGDFSWKNMLKNYNIKISYF